MWPVFKLAARAAVWRTTPEPRLVGLASLLGWTLLLAAVRVAQQFFAAAPYPNFNPYGLNAMAAWLALDLAVAGLFVRPAGRTTALAAMFALSILAEAVIVAAKLGATLLPVASEVSAYWTGQGGAIAIFAAGVLWWLGAMWCVIGSLEPNEPRRRLLARVAALWLALFAANALVPHAPAFVGRDFNIRNANWWEYVHARYLARSDGAGGQAARDAPPRDGSQGALLEAEIARLAPQRAGVTDVYAIGVAGWADEDVFIKELDGALDVLGRILPIRERTVRLVNHAETAGSVPRADPRNFAAAVHAVAGLIDKDEDVLLLLMTSHGDAKGFALQMPGKVMAALTPQDVAATLEREGIKNRVVIVSACYAGIFLPPLASDTSIVLTAADDKSASFGCSTQREWTYFGDALFRQSLRPGTDLRRAFEQAKVLIRGWELMDRVPPSNPQGHFGPALVERLDPLFHPAPREAR